MTITEWKPNFEFSWAVSLELDTENSSKLVSTKSKFSQTMTNGTTSNKIDQAHEELLILDKVGDPNNSRTIDLTNLVDMLSGDTFAFSKVKFIVVTLEANSDATTATEVVIEPGASNGWLGYWKAAGSKSSIFKGGPGYVGGDPVTGITVDSTHKTLKFTNLDTVNEAKVRVVLGGIKV